MDNGQAVTKAPHKFQKGVSGNPAGRPKGSKNKITLMKIALEGDLRTRLGQSAHQILQVAIQKAIEGDTGMIKLLVDKMIPTSKSVDDEPAKERVQIFIDRLKDERTEVKGRTFEEESIDV
jgi:hypothetical protein